MASSSVLFNDKNLREKLASKNVLFIDFGEYSRISVKGQNLINKWRRQHPRALVQIISAHDFMSRNIPLSDTLTGDIKVILRGHCTTGSNAITADSGECYTYLEIAQRLIATLGKRLAIISFTGCSGGRGVTTHPQDSSFKSFAAKLHKRLRDLGHNVPIVARTETVYIKKSGKKVTPPLQNASSEEENLSAFISKQPGSKIIYLSDRNGVQLKLDAYKLKWKSTLLKKLGNIKNSDRIIPWLRQIEMMTSDEIAYSINDSLKISSTLQMPDMVEIRQALQKMMRSWESIATSEFDLPCFVQTDMPTEYFPGISTSIDPITEPAIFRNTLIANNAAGVQLRTLVSTTFSHVEEGANCTFLRQLIDELPEAMVEICWLAAANTETGRLLRDGIAKALFELGPNTNMTGLQVLVTRKAVLSQLCRITSMYSSDEKLYKALRIEAAIFLLAEEFTDLTLDYKNMILQLAQKNSPASKMIREKIAIDLKEGLSWQAVNTPDTLLVLLKLTVKMQDEDLLNAVADALPKKSLRTPALHLIAEYAPQSALELIKLAAQSKHQKLLSALAQTLTDKSNQDWTGLQSLTRFAPQAMRALIKLTIETQHNDLSAAISKALSKKTKDQWTGLHFLARYTCDSLPKLIQHLLEKDNDENDNLFAILRSLATPTNTGTTAWHLISSDEDECKEQILNSTTRRFTSISPLQLKAIGSKMRLAMYQDGAEFRGLCLETGLFRSKYGKTHIWQTLMQQIQKIMQNCIYAFDVNDKDVQDILEQKISRFGF